MFGNYLMIKGKAFKLRIRAQNEERDGITENWVNCSQRCVRMLYQFCDSVCQRISFVIDNHNYGTHTSQPNDGIDGRDATNRSNIICITHTFVSNIHRHHWMLSPFDHTLWLWAIYWPIIAKQIEWLTAVPIHYKSWFSTERVYDLMWVSLIIVCYVWLTFSHIYWGTQIHIQCSGNTLLIAKNGIAQGNLIMH